MPASTLMRVDLPAPFSPIQQWTSPALMSMLTSSSAWTPGNRFEMPVIAINGSDAASGTSRVLDGCHRFGYWVLTHSFAASVVGLMRGGDERNLRILVRLAVDGSAKEVEGRDSKS